MWRARTANPGYVCFVTVSAGRWTKLRLPVIDHTGDGQYVDK